MLPRQSPMSIRTGCLSYSTDRHAQSGKALVRRTKPRVLLHSYLRNPAYIQRAPVLNETTATALWWLPPLSENGRRRPSKSLAGNGWSNKNRNLPPGVVIGNKRRTCARLPPLPLRLLRFGKRPPLRREPPPHIALVEVQRPRRLHRRSIGLYR